MFPSGPAFAVRQEPGLVWTNTMSHYQLACPVCGSRFDDDGFLLTCPRQHAPASLTTHYSSPRLACDSQAEGLYRYQCWLPDRNRLARTATSVTYQSRD